MSQNPCFTKCFFPYCCYFEKDEGPYLSEREARKIAEKINKEIEEFAIYIGIHGETGHKIYKIKTKAKNTLKFENPLKDENNQFGKYPCYFLSEEGHLCEIYEVRLFACVLYFCKDI